MISKFQRQQRKIIVFQKQKRKVKVPNFQGNSLAFQLRTAGKLLEQGEKWNEDFMEPLMEAQKEDAKQRERGR